MLPDKNNTADKDALDKLRAEHSKRVFALYEEKSARLQKLLTGFVSFGLAFFLLVLLPYTSVQMEQQTLSEELRQLTQQLEKRRANIGLYREVMQAGVELGRALREAPQELRRYIQELELTPLSSSNRENPALQMPMIQQRQSPSPQGCDLEHSAGSDDWLNCRVKERVLKDFESYQRILERIIYSVEKMDNPPPALDAEVLKQSLARLENDFQDKLRDKPDFWRSFEGKGEFFQLDPESKALWEKLENLVERQLSGMQQELQVLEEHSREVTTLQAELENKEKQISSRLSQIESPLGKLPVGLSESILVFPLLMALGFLLCSGLLCETVRLRAAFHALYQATDPGREILSDQQVALIAPLWIDPTHPERARLSQWLIFILPALLFAASCVLIAWLWQIPGSFNLTDYLNRWVYSAVYACSILIVAASWLRLHASIRNYRPSL